MQKSFVLLLFFSLVSSCATIDLTNLNSAREQGIQFEFSPTYNNQQSAIYAKIVKKEEEWDLVSFISKPKNSNAIHPPYEVLVISPDGKHIQPYWTGGRKHKSKFNDDDYEYVWSCHYASSNHCNKYRVLGGFPSRYVKSSANRSYYSVHQAEVANAYFNSGLKRQVDTCIDNKMKIDDFRSQLKAEHHFSNKSGFNLKNEFSFTTMLARPFRCGQNIDDYSFLVKGKMNNMGIDDQGNVLLKTKKVKYSSASNTVEFNYIAARKKTSSWNINKLVKGKEFNLQLISIDNSSEGRTSLEYMIHNNSENFIEIEKISVSHGGDVRWDEIAKSFPPNSKSNSTEHLSLRHFDSLTADLSIEEAKSKKFDLEISIQYKSNSVTRSSVFRFDDPILNYISEY